ncbi:NUDIX hydrolase [Actinomadura atramentaria]|uniref:NUDIX hydrolase n=1 Tax=Actinomadura atramentaria TaxID=1990 RepID=UPI0003693E42|nr:NUDIX hydrolase [Actinomadura atramentaria]
MTAVPRAAGVHGDAVRLLSSWVAPDAGQEALRREFLAHLAAFPAAADRACAAGHLTASALVVDADRARVLLMLHRKLGLWVQLGGHCEPSDASLAGTALREATEESGLAGLRLDPVPPALERYRAVCRPGGSWHLNVHFAAVAPPDARPVASNEADDLRWFTRDELPDSLEESLRRLVDRVLT